MTIKPQPYQLADSFSPEQAITAENCSRLAMDSAKYRAEALARGDATNALYHQSSIIAHAQYLEWGLTQIAAREGLA